MGRSSKSRRSSTRSARSTPSRSKSKPSKKTPASKRKAKTPKASEKKKSSKKKTFEPYYDEDTLEEFDEAIKKIAAKRKVKIFEVTADNAEDIHAELRRGGHARVLTKGKVRTEFMYNYFSCKHGSYLNGSSKLDKDIPDDREYSQKYSKSNFWWNGLRIFALRQKTGDKLLCGFVVMHNAYLSMYPGSDEDHYCVDPVMKAGKKNITKEIGNARLGSDTWADVPILCGSGHGDILLAIALANCGMKNVIVSVATGEENDAMQNLLGRWGFDKLDMTHPETGEAWEDEDGDESFVMYRMDDVTAEEIIEHSKEEKKVKPAPEKKKAKAKSSKATKAAEKKSANLSKKMKEMKEKSKAKVDKIKDKQKTALANKDKQLDALKEKLKEKDSIIADLKAKYKAFAKTNKANKSKIVSLVKEAYDSILGEDIPAPGEKKPKKKKPTKKRKPEPMEEEPKKKASKKRKTPAKSKSSAKRRRSSRR